MNLFGFIKGILIRDENDKTKALSLEVDPSATTDTQMTIKSAQTADRTINIPDASDTLVGKATTDILTNKSIDADTNILTNIEDADIKALAAIDASKLADGTVSNTEYQYINSLTSNAQDQLDAGAAALAAHLADAVDAHDASAISNIPAGSISATDVQSAIDELDSDNQANAAALAAHLADAVDAHDASAISNVPSGNLAATDVQSALNELQSENDTHVVGPVSSTDNALVRFDSTTGKLIQDSVGILDDSGALSGLTQLNVDNLQLDGNTVSATSGDLILDGADIDANNNIIKNVSDPSSAQDAATKAYVDSFSQGVAWKQPVKVATTANITLSGEQTIDGILTSASRVLVKDQSDQTQNGIYVSSAGAWTRATDMDASADFDSAAIFVSEGTVNSDKGWVQTTDSVNLGVSNIVFAQFTGISGGANTALSNLITTSINAALIPANNSIDLGTTTTAFRNGYFNNIVGVYNGSNPNLQLTDSGFVVPSSASVTAVMNSQATQSFAIFSSNSGSSSGNVNIETGNASAGTSGNLTLQTGTATGTRGSLLVKSNNFDVSNVSQGLGLPIWKKYTVAESAFTAAATSEDIELFSLPAKGVIHNVIIKHSAAFTGGTLSAFTLSVGISGNLTKYASAFNVFQAPGTAVGQTSTAVDFEDFTSSVSIRLAAVSVGDNVISATAGSVDVYVLWGVLP